MSIHKILEINNEAVRFFTDQLNESGRSIRREFPERYGLNDEMIEKFRLGYSGESGIGLTEYLRTKGYSEELMIDSGLAKQNTQGKILDVFCDRIMFPLCDPEQNVLGFGGLAVNESQPRWLIIERTEAFDPETLLYGFEHALRSSADYIIVCEGFMDVLMLNQYGFDMAVSTVGRTLSGEQISILMKKTSNIIICYDNDNEGDKMSAASVERIKGMGLHVKKINTEPYRDPAEFLRKMGRDAFEEKINIALQD